MWKPGREAGLFCLQGSKKLRSEPLDRRDHTHSDLGIDLSCIFQSPSRPDDLPIHPRPNSRLTSSWEMPFPSRTSRRASESPPSTSSSSGSSSKGAASRARSTGSDVARKASRTRTATGRSWSGRSSISRCNAFLPLIAVSTSTLKGPISADLAGGAVRGSKLEVYCPIDASAKTDVRAERQVLGSAHGPRPGDHPSCREYPRDLRPGGLRLPSPGNPAAGQR